MVHTTQYASAENVQVFFEWSGTVGKLDMVESSSSHRPFDIGVQLYIRVKCSHRQHPEVDVFGLQRVGAGALQDDKVRVVLLHRVVDPPDRLHVLHPSGHHHGTSWRRQEGDSWSTCRLTWAEGQMQHAQLLMSSCSSTFTLTSSFHLTFLPLWNAFSLTHLCISPRFYTSCIVLVNLVCVYVMVIKCTDDFIT